MINKIIKWVVLATVFLLPLFFLPFTLEVFEFNKFYLLLALTGFGVLAWFGKMIFQEKKIRFKVSLLDPFVLAFLVITAVSSFLSVDKVSSWLGFYGRFWPSGAGILCLGLFYFLVVNNVEVHKKENRATLSGVLKVFLISSFAVSAFAYLSVFNVLPKLATHFNKALPSVMTLRTFNPVAGSLEALALFLVCCSALLIALLALRDKKGLLGTSEKEKQRGWMLYVLLFADLGLLVLINFRPAWIALIASLILFLVFAFWKRLFKENVNRLSLSVFFVLIGLFFLFFNPLKQILPADMAINNLPSEVLLNQRASWGLAWQGLKDMPVMGSGPGTFYSVFALHKPAGFMQSDFWQLRFDRAGSALAEFVSTNGVVGILGYLGLIGMFGFISYLFISSVKTHGISAVLTGASAQDREERKIIVLPFLTTFVSLFVAQIFYYQNISLAFFFFLMMALGVVSWSGRKERVFNFKDFPEVGLVFSILFWVCLTVVVFAFFTFSKYYVADVFYKTYLENPSANFSKLESAVKLNPNQAVYHIALAKDYLGRFQDEAKKASPDTQVITNLMVLAVREAKAAMAVGKNRISAFEMAGVTYEALGGAAKDANEWAIKSFEDGLKIEPQNPALLTELGKIFLSNDNKEKAREYFDRAVGVRPAYIEAQLGLAYLDNETGNADAVKSRLENLVKLAPFSVDARFELGRVYFNNKDYDKAREQFEAAVVLFPNHSNSLYSLGLSYEKLDRVDDALSVLEKVLELNPGNKDVQEKIDDIKAGNLNVAETKNYSQEELNLESGAGAADATTTGATGR